MTPAEPQEKCSCDYDGVFLCHSLPRERCQKGGPPAEPQGDVVEAAHKALVRFAPDESWLSLGSDPLGAAKDVVAAITPLLALEVKERLERVEGALRAIRGPEDWGPWIAIYRDSGGGYGGLQAIADAALDAAPSEPREESADGR